MTTQPLSPTVCKIIRKWKAHGYDLLPYVTPAMPPDMVNQIGLGLITGVEVEKYAREGFTGGQARQARLALEDEQPVSHWWYRPEVEWWIMQVCRLTEKFYIEPLTPEYLARFSREQIYEIAAVLEQSLDAKPMFDPDMPVAQMRAIRHLIEDRFHRHTRNASKGPTTVRGVTEDGVQFALSIA